MNKLLSFLWYILFGFACLIMTVCSALGAELDTQIFPMDVIYIHPEDMMRTSEPSPTATEEIIPAVRPDFMPEIKFGKVFTFGYYDQDGNSDNGPEPIGWQVLSAKRKEEPIKFICTIVPENFRTAETESELEQMMNEFIHKAFREDEQSCIVEKGFLDDDQFKGYERRFKTFGISSDDWNLRPVIRLDLMKWNSLSPSNKIDTPMPNETPTETVFPTMTETISITATVIPSPTPPTPPNPEAKPIVFFIAIGILLVCVGAGGFLIGKNHKKKNNKKQKKGILDQDQTITLPKGEQDSEVSPKSNVINKRIVYTSSGCKGQGKRDYQEDSLWYSNISATDSPVCAVIADGMGGMDNGAESSEIAINVFKSRAAQIRPEKDIPSQLYDICKAANKAIYETNSAKGMNGGSTLVSVFLINSMLYWISIGDSRIYLYRNGMLASVNEEHELENKMYNGLMNGDIALVDIREMNDRELRKLTSNLGRSSISLVDQNFIPYQLLEGDKLLLCSDGVSGTLDDNEILDCLKDPDPDVNCDRIVEMVELKNKKGQDNFSAVVVSVALESKK